MALRFCYRKKPSRSRWLPDFYVAKIYSFNMVSVPNERQSFFMPYYIQFIKRIDWCYYFSTLSLRIKSFSYIAKSA